MTVRRLIALLLFVLLSCGPALAVLQPAEMLEDPALEARARELSQQLRCLVCQNQSIDDSDAELARDLRVLVREKIVSGASDEEVLDYVVSRYGEFVLLRPRFNLRNAALWLAPLLILAAGGFYLARSARRAGAASGGALSAEEEEALRRALGEREPGPREDY